MRSRRRPSRSLQATGKNYIRAIGTARQAPAVIVEGLQKTFRVPDSRRTTLRARVVDRLRRRPDQILPAVDDVSFEVRRGECLGIVGRNGSGKSTLLKCIAGIYDIDSGTVEVDGSLSPFVELGVAASGELSGRDNVVVTGVLLGLSRREAVRRVDEIVDFAELGDFAELPVKNYSSGMAVRLMFSVAVRVEADVMLIDEVLAVGDAAFQTKCHDEFARMKAEGRTILLVTHDMAAVERLCDRALLLEHGRVVDMGETATITRRYRELNAGHARGDGIGARPRDADASVRPSPRRRNRRYRPRALGGDLRSLWTTTATLALVQFKLHYLGSVLGYAWAVMRPLMLFAVTYFVFTRVGSFDDGVRDYGVYLLTTIVLWTFFAEATSNAATSLLASQDLLRKLRFPRLAIPLASVTRALLNLALNFIAVAVLVAASGVRPRLSWLELPLLVALLSVLAAGTAILLSALFVRIRDIAQIWTVVLQLLFFGSSVLYVVTEFPSSLQEVMIVNPLTMIFTEMRHALIDPSAPSAADVAGSTALLAIPLATIAAVLAAAFWAFNRETPRMAESV